MNHFVFFFLFGFFKLCEFFLGHCQLPYVSLVYQESGTGTGEHLTLRLLIHWFSVRCWKLASFNAGLSVPRHADGRSFGCAGNTNTFRFSLIQWFPISMFWVITIFFLRVSAHAWLCHDRVFNRSKRSELLSVQEQSNLAKWHLKIRGVLSSRYIIALFACKV